MGIAIDWDSSLNPIKWDFSSGGTVTTVVTYASGNTITVTTAIPLTQEQVFIEGMATLYKAFENGLDKLTRIAKEEDARLFVVELAIALGGTVLPSAMTYLGRLATDPITTGWGVAQAFWLWFDLSSGRGKYWSGSEILMF